MFASLTHFHRHLGLPGTPHRWYLHDWGAWKKHLETCSLGLQHLKNALPTKQAGLAQPSGTALPERFWPHPAISVIGLVCLCSRWASRSRNRVAKQQAVVLAFTAFLRRLLLTLGKAWSIIIYTRGASLGFVAECMYTVCLCRSSHVGGHVYFVLGGYCWLRHGFKQCCFGWVHHGLSLLPMGWVHLRSLFADPSLLDTGCDSLCTLCRPIDLALGRAFTHIVATCVGNPPLLRRTLLGLAHCFWHAACHSDCEQYVHSGRHRRSPWS